MQVPRGLLRCDASSVCLCESPPFSVKSVPQGYEAKEATLRTRFLPVLLMEGCPGALLSLLPFTFILSILAPEGCEACKSQDRSYQYEVNHAYFFTIQSASQLLSHVTLTGSLQNKNDHSGFIEEKVKPESREPQPASRPVSLPIADGPAHSRISLLEKHQKEYVDPPENALILVLWAVKRGSLMKPLVGVNSADADVRSR
ncbi:hypothetical protein MJG53_016529 [Ovis ammon polii x Ovis aries]|uniref:Uncharacterized protein n=1 Tax=Ovis ammon polii x Ovis aries TaxID=2918886 RepID=A0ACB9UC25_9CETA|nr:hypothetical protein MJT46_016219 [Ovis ammon polii x Ovis aries]KAI4563955.1 hypothetical protein MJG53_016529 [Ovis ammon polii x Ovis aries]